MLGSRANELKKGKNILTTETRGNYESQVLPGFGKRGTTFSDRFDLVLKEHADHEQILRDGKRLGKVVAEAARKFRTPLAMPVMDLMLEKALMLRAMGGVSEADIPTYHFSSCPTQEQVSAIRSGLERELDPRLQANIDAVKYIAGHTDLVPVGMSIGPFSLMTKLVSEPITSVYMAGMGLTAQEDNDVKMIETLMEIAVEIILRSFRAQAAAGAKAFFIAEPAANMVYVSPKQMESGSDVFERVVLKYLRRIKDEMDKAGVDLIFHCCGEVTNEMIKGFVSLRPVMISLGSSRKLWEDAAIIPDDIVIYGNLPSKKFFSDEVSVSDVRRMSLELIARMKATRHPYILGTECDVLSVPGCEVVLKSKVMAIVNCLGEQARKEEENIQFPGEPTKVRQGA
jgi:uroporphyrinogen-III decarboxylase